MLNSIAYDFATKHSVDIVDVHALITLVMTQVMSKITTDNYEIPKVPSSSPPNDWLSELENIGDK